MRRWLAEPLVHFLAIGAGLFLLHGIVAPEDPDDDRIVVSRAAIADLEAQHERTYGRPPTAAELERLIETQVSDEISYREGVAMGLDRDDSLIKRRVRQKFELIAEEEASVAPTEGELERYLAANPERFRSSPIASFSQVLVPPAASDEALAANVAAAKAALDAGAQPETVGRATLLPLRSVDVSLDRVAAEFGEGFAGALAGLPEGRWQGPVLSSYGLHLVRIDGRTEAFVPPLAEIRAAVQREWENDRRVRARDARLQALRERYEVVVEEEGGP